MTTVGDRILGGIQVRVWEYFSGLNEPKRLIRLRPHLDSEPESRDRQTTARVQKWAESSLETLSLLELALSIGCLKPSDLDTTRWKNLIPQALLTSPALARFVDYYLFFGVRFLAGRIEAKTQESGSTFALAFPPVALPPDRPGSPTTDMLLTKYLGLQQGDAGNPALQFLDSLTAIQPDTPKVGQPKALSQHVAWELWLRGLYPEAEAKFHAKADQLVRWVEARVGFYRSVEGLQPDEALRPAWMARNPLSARFAINDLYWLARILHCDVSSVGQVSYFPKKSLLAQLAIHAEFDGDPARAQKLREYERLLRAVFDYACDTIQNSVELTEEARPSEQTNKPSSPTVHWRAVFDEELIEIGHQRLQRTSLSRPPETTVLPHHPGWARRIISGEYPHEDVIGLAFSGGGIRSATFGLGVLEGLQEFDLLRDVDYLSTVSGGGYIGAWLVGNVTRSSHWLGRLTNWEQSIAHLRKYARYLAPHSGLFSADTWTVAGIWLRNAVLIQLTGLAWLLFALCFCFLLEPLFVGISVSSQTESPARWVTGLLLLIAAVASGYRLYRADTPEPARPPRWWRGESGVLWCIVVPAWAAAFLTAALLWADASGNSTLSPLFAGRTQFSEILAAALALQAPQGSGTWDQLISSLGMVSNSPWKSLLGLMFALLTALAMVCMRPREFHVGSWKTVLPAILAWLRSLVASIACAAFSTLVLFLEFCAVMYLFLGWVNTRVSHYDWAVPGWALPPDPRYPWYALVLGPSLCLAAVTVAVVILMGLCGRTSSESTREWWTRLGSWLGMFGLAWLILAVAAIFGPWWVLQFVNIDWGITAGTIVSIVGTVASGLVAGNSSKTNGASQGSDAKIELLAPVGAVVFLVAALFGVATLLYSFLLNVATSATMLPADYWSAMREISQGRWWVPGTAAVTLALGLLFSWRVELNIFSLNHFYRNRLVRCYLGASVFWPRTRTPNSFTGFDPNDDILLNSLRAAEDPEKPFRGPFPIINCSLNLGGSDDLSVVTRQSASFSLTPLHCGSSRARVGFVPTKDYGGGKVKLGQAIAVSGAAASPNMGYHTSTLVSFFLTMFNVRLGWWFSNPSSGARNKERLPSFGFAYLLAELFGLADEKRDYLNVSDGGHFENLGIYELIRRRVRVIIASDGECDPDLQFGSLGNLIRICDTDFGAKIDIDVSSIRKQPDGNSLTHCSVGRIYYSNGSRGWLIYLKSSIVGDEDVSVAQYRETHPTFPHESTADQFFTEDQFESYRRLGRHVVRHAFRGTQLAEYLPNVAERLSETWAPAGFSSTAFLKHTETLNQMWEKFRNSSGALGNLLTELSHNPGRPTTPPPATVPPTPAELCACLELTQLMENVFIDLRLDAFWNHPDNRGWAMLFSGWARSPKFRAAWQDIHRTYGIRFEYFCEERLGLQRERPVARV